MASPLTFAQPNARKAAVTARDQEEESMARSFRLIAVAVVAVLALAMPAFAAQAKAAKGKTMTISGTLQKVDGQTLTVQTPKGSETVMLGANAQIRRAGKPLAVSDLASESGSRITIRYMENNGQKMAQSVTLAARKSEGKKVASASPAPAAKGTKK
jgi:hypothetical protein